jgi:hypothetical protein
MRKSMHTESHARIFGLSLAALLAACLVLSPSTRNCQQSDRDFGTTGAQGGEEPGYGTLALTAKLRCGVDRERDVALE